MSSSETIVGIWGRWKGNLNGSPYAMVTEKNWWCLMQLDVIESPNDIYLIMRVNWEVQDVYQFYFPAVFLSNRIIFVLQWFNKGVNRIIYRLRIKKRIPPTNTLFRVLCFYISSSRFFFYFFDFSISKELNIYLFYLIFFSLRH